MNTCEMVLLADENGKTYKMDSLYYDTKRGFCDIDGKKWPYDPFESSGLNYFVHMNRWELFEPEYTMEELFSKIGYKFKIK